MKSQYSIILYEISIFYYIIWNLNILIYYMKSQYSNILYEISILLKDFNMKLIMRINNNINEINGQWES